MKAILSVDPGWHTGWAYWLNSKYAPNETGQINLNRVDNPTLELKLENMLMQFEELLTPKPIVSLVLLEGVQLWGGSAKSYSAGTKGDLSGLAYLVGGYAQICFNKNIDFKIIDPTDWKGQMNDAIIKERIFRAIGQKYKTEHIRSAVGLGLEHLGLL